MNIKEELNEIYFECGAGLFDSQALEYDIKYLIYLMSALQFADISPDKAEEIIDGKSKQTIGQLLKFLKGKNVTFSSDLEQNIWNGIAARNKLIHHYLIDNIERMAQPTTRSEVVKEIKNLRKLIQQGDKGLRQFLDSLSAISTGLSLTQLKEKIQKELRD